MKEKESSPWDDNYEKLMNSCSIEEVAKLINEACDYVIDSEFTDMRQGILEWLSKKI